MLKKLKLPQKPKRQRPKRRLSKPPACLTASSEAVFLFNAIASFQALGFDVGVLENNHHAAYLQRLKEVVQRLGVAHLAAQVGISQAQLYRYLNGTPLPHPRLAAIAKAADVTTDWLLFGTQTAHLNLHATLDVMSHVTQTVLTTLQVAEHDGLAWRPSELQYLIPLFVLNELNCQQHRPEWRLTEAEVLKTLDVVRHLRRTRQLEPYVKYLAKFYATPTTHLEDAWAGPVCSYLDSAVQAYFESQAGASYYHRVAYTLRDVNLQVVANLVKNLEQLQLKRRLKVLDFGAGSGRYLRHFNKNYPDWFELWGIERSAQGWKYIEEFRQAGDLNGVQLIHGDYLTQELPAGAMDAVLCYMNLHYYPYVKNSIHHGVGKVLAKMAETLRKGGILHLTLRGGILQTFSPYYTRAHSIQELTVLLKSLGLNLIENKFYNNPKKLPIGHEIPIGFELLQEAFFKKI
jgi:SAM-dependent methyltransferase/transcriptional regulator with XRE-family HTH domain